MILRIASAVLLLVSSAAIAHAAALELRSSETKVTLVELYTSEGCSSCPPADRWMSGLVDDARLWRQVVPVAFHVDYWDYIGWPDRFASPRFSDRQRRYARIGHVSTVYTPGFVVDGREWRSWFTRPKLETAADDVVGRIVVRLDGEEAEASYRPMGRVDTAGGELEIHVAVLGFGLETEVARGENRGRTLRHDFVVLGHRRVAAMRDGARYHARLRLPEPSTPSERRAVAAWVSAPGDPRPIQAVGGWLR